MKILLLNVKYSLNFGDGVIVECLEWVIVEFVFNFMVVFLDVGGWVDYGEFGIVWWDLNGS